LIDGLRPDRKSSLIYPILFIERRVAFILVIMLFMDFFMVQIVFQVGSTMGILCYLLHYRPFCERKAQLLEVFNEVCSLVAMNLVLAFTDANPTDSRDSYDYIFLSLLLSIIGVHIFFIVV